MKAVIDGNVIAESNDTIKIETDYYFPVETVKMDFLKKGNNLAECDPQGDACYYDVVIEGKILKDAASSFSSPVEASEQLKDFIVFKSPIEIKE